MKRIATLLTCHNRKEKTINCLNSFYEVMVVTKCNITFDIYLVDDGSTDGTYEQIVEHFPEVNVIKGSGTLYWAGGMRLAWETALNNGCQYDSFLLLNDDVILSENFLNDLLKTHDYCLSEYHQAGMYVCSTKCFINSEISYGGTLIKHKGIKITSTRINPGAIPLPCTLVNANILMVTMPVVKAIGILDSNYIHQFADFDYSLMACRKGIPVLVCPGIGGWCSDDHGKRWMTSDFSLRERLNYLNSPLGLAYKEQLYYLRKNFKFQFPYYFCALWLKTFFPFLWDVFKKDTNHTLAC